MHWLVIILLLFSWNAFSKTEAFVSEGKNYVLTYPEGWISKIDLLDIPITVLGPMVKDYRPLIAIVPTGLTNKMIPESEYPKVFAEFKSHKEAWVNKHSGKLVKYDPTTMVSLRPDLKGHFIGAEFIINQIHYIERSYYLYCSGQLVNIKYSLRDELRSTIPVLEKIAGSLKCL